MSIAAVESAVVHLALGEHTIIIDDADHAAVSRYTWRLYTPSPSRTRRTHYARAWVNGERVYLHLFLWKLWGKRKAPIVEHENGNGLDCRYDNLRRATIAQNNRNRGAQRNNTSGFKGVNWDVKQQAWRARVQAAGKRITVGYFTRPEEAAAAYDRMARRRHGRFAVLNKVAA